MSAQLDNETLSSLIGGIYECSIDHSLWIPTLERLAGAFAACNGTILSHDARTVSFDYPHRANNGAHASPAFEKTGTRRQSQLMKLVLSTSPPA